MEKAEFTNYLILKLSEYFPQFTEHRIPKPRGIVAIGYQTAQGLLTLWLTTRDKEITVGFSGNHNLNYFHTHMSL